MKICTTEHGILEEMEQQQLLDSEEEEEAEDEQSDDVSYCDDISDSKSDTSDKDE